MLLVFEQKDSIICRCFMTQSDTQQKFYNKLKITK